MTETNKPTNEDAPLLIKLSLVYENGNKADRLVDTFWYYNDDQLTRKQLNDLFKTLSDRGPLIAPKYGLPQLAPVDMMDLAGGAHHPYTVIDDVELLDKPDDNMRLDDASDFLMFSDVFPYLKDDKPCQSYIDSQQRHHKAAAIRALDTAIVHLDEINISTDLLETMKKSINFETKEK